MTSNYSRLSLACAALMVETPGLYRIDARNHHRREDGDNDAWVNLVGNEVSVEQPVERMGDSLDDGPGFSWLDWGVRAFELSKGINNIYIGGRSVGFGIDRIAIYREGDEQAKKRALNLDTPLSALREL